MNKFRHFLRTDNCPEWPQGFKTRFCKWANRPKPQFGTVRSKDDFSFPCNLTVFYHKRFAANRMLGSSCSPELQKRWRKNRAMTRNIKVNPAKFGSRKTNCSVSTQTLTTWRCCGMSSGEPFTPDILEMCSGKRTGPKLSLQLWSRTTGSTCTQLLSPVFHFQCFSHTVNV